MAQDQTVNKGAKGNDHDRVTMLSIKADGTPDQVNPEIIGDKDTALAAAAEQFRQQAVSAVDRELRGVGTAAEGVSTTEDPTVAEIKKAHEAAVSGADKAAAAAVDSLHKGSGK